MTFQRENQDLEKKLHSLPIIIIPMYSIIIVGGIAGTRVYYKISV